MFLALPALGRFNSTTKRVPRLSYLKLVNQVRLELTNLSVLVYETSAFNRIPPLVVMCLVLLLVSLCSDLTIERVASSAIAVSTSPLNYSTVILASPERFELPTLALEVLCSIQLSYGENVFGYTPSA
jgi:hypothetical protein